MFSRRSGPFPSSAEPDPRALDSVNVNVVSTPKDALDKVVKAGWILKRSRFSAYRKYERRYLVLSRARLRYFHSEQHFAEQKNTNPRCNATVEHDSSDNRALDYGCSIPLSVISDVGVSGSQGSAFNKFLKLYIKISSRELNTKLVFKCDAGEAKQWRDAIARTREVFLSSRQDRLRDFTPLVLRRNGRLQRALAVVSTKRLRSATQCSILSEHDILYLTKLGQILLSSESVVIEVAKALFDALSKLSSSRASGDAVEWSKKLGHCAAALLRSEVSPLSPPCSMASASHMDVFPAESHDIAVDAGYGVAYSQHSGEHMVVYHFMRISLLRELEAVHKARRAAPANDIASMPDSDRARAVNRLNQMPFRGNNPESVFIGNFLKCVAKDSGLLSIWLLEPLLKIASSPELSEASLARLDSYVMSTSVPRDDNEEGASAATTSESDARDEAAQKQSTMNALIDASTHSIINSILSHVADTPVPLRMLITEIFRITAPRPKDIDSAKITKSNPKFAVDIFSEFGSDDERNYCQACCGLLILRVVCPAILSPLEWGVLRHRPSIRPPSLTSDITPPYPAATLSPDSDVAHAISSTTQAPVVLSSPITLGKHIKDVLASRGPENGGVSVSRSASMDDADLFDESHRKRGAPSGSIDAELSSFSHDETVTTEGECIVVDECDGVRSEMNDHDHYDVYVDLSRNTAFMVLLSHILMSAPDVLQALEGRLLATTLPESMVRPPSLELSQQPLSACVDMSSGNLEDRTISQSPERKGFFRSMISKIVSSSSFGGEPTSGRLSSASPKPPVLNDNACDLKSWAISLSELMAGICNDIPIAKVDEILAADAQSSTSLVDSSTERAFQSPELRRYLVALAKGVQRAANSSCLPEAELRPVEAMSQCTDEGSPGASSPESPPPDSASPLPVGAVCGDSSWSQPLESSTLRIAFALKEVYQRLVVLDPEIDDE